MEKTAYPIKEFFSKGAHLASPWDNLSIREKAEMMKVAVRNGITNLPDIKQKYNEFAGGGRKKSKANSLKQNFLTSLDQSLREDGTFNTPQYRRFFTDLARQESGYYPTITNSIGAKGYFQLMPGNRSASWSNPTQQFHETYKLVKSNIDYFNKKLTKKDWDRARELGIDLYGLLGGAHLGGVGGVVRALRGKGNAKDMNGSSVLGYMRQFSQSGKPTTYTQVPQAPQVSQGVPPISEPIQNMSEETVDFIPWNPQAFFGVNNNTPIIIQQEAPVVAEKMPTPEEIERQERQQGLANFQTIMGMLNSTSDNTSTTMTPFESTVSMLTQQSPIHYFSDGGSIHIKPSHRGRFTALKERTGHSASWFKENGTPAQKKMAIFDLNSRHWKHGDGGDMHIYNGGELPEVTVTAYAPLRLTTHYPITSEYYPYTGHSELDIPIDRKTWYDYTGEKIDSDMRFPYVTIDKTSEAKDYNLVTNNCADATLKYLNAAFGTSEKPWLFTTPGDVRDYALKKLNGKLIKNLDGSDTVLIPRNAKIAAKLSKTALNMLESTPEGTAYSSRWIGQFHRHGLGGNLFGMGGGNPFTVGATIDSLYASNPKEEFLGEPDHHYDFTQSEEWADAHGYYPDARGHRDDRVKKLTHPSHPSRGTWNGDTFMLSDLGMQNPNYTLFGLNDGGQDPQATLTYNGGVVLPEITVTPKENYIFNPYDNIILHQKALGGNLFDIGGPKSNNPRIVTTGGAGYVPSNYGQGSIDYIRRALYDNITPFGYHNPAQRVFNAIANKQDDSRAGENARINSGNAVSSALDAIWGTYLGIPVNQRRKINSKYNISKVPEGYYKFNDPNLVLYFDSELSPQGLYSQKGRKAQQMNGILGNYTVGLGRDNKGDYIYYSDSRLNKDGSPDLKTGWDINPYSNTVDDATEETTESRGQYGQDKKSLSYKVGKSLFGNISDLSMGIGKPVPIYDRVYLDDYYKVPSPYRGGVYLPEVTVYGKRRKKKALGGNLFEDGGPKNSKKKEGPEYIFDSTMYTHPNDTAGLLAEQVVTPNGNYPVLNPKGGEAWTIEALNDLGVPLYTKTSIPKQKDVELQHLEDKAKADAHVAMVTPTAEDLFTIGTLGGLNNLSPTQWVRRAYDLGEAIKGNMSWDKFGNNWFYGNNGLVSDEYAQEHPYASAAINFTGDAAAFGALSALRKLPKYATASTPQITAESAASITPAQWTALQDAAIARGDMAEAQRLRDLHFKVKSNTVVQNNNLPLKTYHTVNESYPANFNVFNPNIEGTHSAIYTSDSPIMSGTYANSLISNEEKEYYIQRGIDNLKYLVENNLAKGDDLIKARNALKSTESAREYVLSKTPWLNTRIVPERQKQLYVKLNNPLMIEGHGRNWNDIPIHELPKKVYDNLRASNMNGYTTRDIERAQKLAGYDGGIIKNITDYGSTRKSAMIERKPSTVYQINEPNQLKLADAVTYDDNGVRIPLGDRDNFNVNDIRWSWLLPVFGVGAGATAAE